MAARRLRLKEAFRPSLDRLGVTRDPPTRARVGRTLAELVDATLPGRGDFEALLYPVGTAWARRIAGRSLWLLYRFDVEEVIVFVLVDREPVSVGD